MPAILFASQDSPLKPAIAAACARGLNLQGLRVGVAAGGRRAAVEAARQALTGLGLTWPAEIQSLRDIEFATFDLVVFLANGDRPLPPALPGNPAIIAWHLPEPKINTDGRHDPAACQALRGRIAQLVEDLLGQDYLAALIQARKNAELVMDNLHEGIIAHDLNRRLFFFNKAAERITGYARQEVLGRDCHDVFPDRLCRGRCSFCDPGKAEPPLPERPYPVILKTRTGETRQIEMSIVCIRDFNGKPVGIVGSFRDITREFELATRLGEVEEFAGLIGHTPAMQELYRAIRELAGSNVPVLIEGESGTGKELVAAAIHREGGRAGKPFVPVNCGALPENLLETELFGHVRGAFTGAIRDKKGRFELADSGTLFLDEIGDITPAMQVKLLRVLQDGSFQRVGSEQTRQVHVRVISATHKDLAREVTAGRFREDLYYRLCVVPLHLPPLRERLADLPLLAGHFLKQILTEEHRPEVVIAPETMDILMHHDWPGNIRELHNVIRYLLVRCRGDLARPQHLPPSLFKPRTRSGSISSAAPAKQRGKLTPDAVRRALKEAGGNRLQAARALGVARATLYRFFAKHRSQ